MIKFNVDDKRTLPKCYINIGALLDIPTSSIITGLKGESIINGGLGPITAVVGPGNNMKSLVTHYMMLSAADKVFNSHETAICTYDSENNVSIDRLEELSNGFEHLPKNMITDTGHWFVTDKSVQLGDVWDEKVLKPYIAEKKKDKDSKCKYGPFRDPYSKQELEMLVPSFVEIDSMSEFEGTSSNDMLAKNLDGSDTNTFAMKQGLFKTKFLQGIPSMAIGSNTYFLVTAQLGEKVDMRTGPAMYQQPLKVLQYLKSGEHIKGVSSKFYFLTHNAWYLHTAKDLVNDNTKLPEYPLDTDQQKTDLKVMTLTQLRGKNGPSGFTTQLVISQDKGVLPSLTEFHYIKENKRFGIDGTLQSYHLDLYPEVSLSRTTVRTKLDNDFKLRRAVNITAELHQLGIYHDVYKAIGLICSPKDLYEDIKKMGYDWDTLLNTRGYWTLDQYDNKLPYLSTIDLLNMRVGKYHPYWLEDDKKTLKKKYQMENKNAKSK